VVDYWIGLNWIGLEIISAMQKWDLSIVGDWRLEVGGYIGVSRE